MALNGLASSRTGWSFLAVVGLGAAPAGAQWHVDRLRPTTSVGASRVLAVGPGVQGGYALVSSSLQRQPSLWNGTAQSWTTLAASPTQSGEVFGISADWQVGELVGHASLWRGTAASRIDLNPAAAQGSDAYGMAGGQQVGDVYIAGGRYAALWTGTATSFVNLHPATATRSVAYATDGMHQGGQIDVASGAAHAALWSGTAASFVDLNPPVAGQSFLFGMAAGQQVGSVDILQGTTHAAIWHGTAASFVDLNPLGGSGMSQLRATTGSVQVGWASNALTGGTAHAGVWYGSAGSFFDLGALLPAQYGESVATSVFEENGIITVGGYAFGPDSAEAFLWTSIPAPSGSGVLLLFACAYQRRRASLGA